MPLKCAPMGSLWGRRTTHTLYESTERKYPKWADPEREREREHGILVARESNCSVGDAEKLESNNGCKTVTTRSLTELCLLDRLFND